MRDQVPSIARKFGKRYLAQFLGEITDGFNVTNLLWNNIIPFVELLARFLGAVVREDRFQDLFMRTFSILKEFLHFSLEILAGDGLSQEGEKKYIVFCGD